MVKLWFVRTQDNASPTWDHQPAADDDAPLAFKDGWGGLEPCWRRMWHWMLGNGVTAGCGPVVPLGAAELEEQVARLNDAAADLRAAAIEPLRVGAAYALAAAGPTQGLAPLSAALVNGAQAEVEVDGVMRSAMYGLAALPDGAGVPALLAAASSTASGSSMELRVSGVFGLGQCAEPTGAVLECLRSNVLEDPSSFVRSTAAHMLGFIGASAYGHSIASLSRQPHVISNRLMRRVVARCGVYRRSTCGGSRQHWRAQSHRRESTRLPSSCAHGCLVALADLECAPN
jgi:hypothetical protein